MEITSPAQEEYAAIQRFLEESYGHSLNYFSTHYPQVWRPENTSWNDILLVKEQSKIVSLVRIFPLKLYLKNVIVTVGGIGAVSTAYSHRGKGYMTRLMQSALTEIEKRGYPFSILWGDRYRYNNFGYEIAGQVLELSVNNRGIERQKVKDIEVKRFLGQEKILAEMFACYDRHPFRKERTLEEFRLLHHRPSLETYYTSQSENFSYLTLGGEGRSNQVLEFGGEATLILGILKHLSVRFGISEFLFRFPDFFQVPSEILSIAANWHIIPAGMIKIIDLKAIFCAYQKLLEENFPEGEEITFQIENKPAVLLKKNKGRFSLAEGTGKNLLKLTNQEAVRLIFGTSFWTPPTLNPATWKIMRSIFPLPIFLWQLDHI